MSNDQNTEMRLLAQKKKASNMWLCFFAGVAVAEMMMNHKLVKNFK